MTLILRFASRRVLNFNGGESLEGDTMTTKTSLSKSKIISPSVVKYLLEDIHLDSELEAELRAETERLPNANMMSTSDVGHFLRLLVGLTQAKKILEVGTFTGYTALMMAQGAPAQARILCCEVNADWASIGEKHWQKAGVREKIHLKLAPAEDTLQGLLNQGEEGTWDFAFVDADKGNYEKYYELCLRLLRPGALIVLDNMLWDGLVADQSSEDKIAKSMRGLNTKVSRDGRVSCSLLSVCDGLLLAQKKWTQKK